MTGVEWAAIISAVAAAIVSVVTAIMTARTSGKVDTVHTMVNGQSVRMENLAQLAGQAQGLAAAGGPPRQLTADSKPGPQTIVNPPA